MVVSVFLPVTFFIVVAVAIVLSRPAGCSAHQLSGNQLGVETILGQKSIVTALLHQVSVIKHYDAVSFSDG